MRVIRREPGTRFRRREMSALAVAIPGRGSVTRDGPGDGDAHDHGDAHGREGPADHRRLAADVALVENGVPREIASFERDARPLTVAVLVDSSAAVSSAYRLNVVEAVVRSRVASAGGHALHDLDHGRPPDQARGLHGRPRRRRGRAETRARTAATRCSTRSWRPRATSQARREGDRTAVVAVTGLGPEFSHRDRERAVEEAEGGATCSFRCRSTWPRPTTNRAAA